MSVVKKKTYYVIGHFHYVLSLGALFAIFAGYYYWSPMVTGLYYNNVLSKIQFWLFFIGANVTFMPMHFLGMNGMPRRIPDYPDAFAGFNAICSLGSVIAIISLLFFGYVIYDQLVNGLVNKDLSTNSLLKDPDFFESNETFKSNEIKSESMEFLLNYPPMFHTFNTVAIQS